MQNLVYNYDLNGYFTNSAIAKKDPLESEKSKRDIYLLPANATFVKPPEKQDSKKIKWDGSKWIYEDIVLPQEPSEEESLDTIRNKKIFEVKLVRDQNNTAPITDCKGFLIDNSGSKTDQESFFIFYTNRHQTNPASDPDSIISRALILGAMPYFTKDLNGNKITIELTSDIAKSLRERISQRNDNNYKVSGILELEIRKSQTVEEIEAITVGIKE